MDTKRRDQEPAEQPTAQVIELLARHLGSAEVARLWLITHSQEFGTTPLALIAAGKVDQVLALLESRWGPNPTYA